MATEGAATGRVLLQPHLYTAAGEHERTDKQPSAAGSAVLDRCRCSHPLPPLYLPLHAALVTVPLHRLLAALVHLRGNPPARGFLVQNQARSREKVTQCFFT